MTPILAFDIETVLDVAGLRRAREVPAEMSDAAVVDWYTQQRRAQTGGDFAPLHLHKVVAIACALRDGAGFKVASVGTPEDTEPDLILSLIHISEPTRPY